MSKDLIGNVYKKVSVYVILVNRLTSLKSSERRPTLATREQSQCLIPRMGATCGSLIISTGPIDLELSENLNTRSAWRLVLVLAWYGIALLSFCSNSHLDNKTEIDLHGLQVKEAYVRECCYAYPLAVPTMLVLLFGCKSEVCCTWYSRNKGIGAPSCAYISLHFRRWLNVFTCQVETKSS